VIALASSDLASDGGGAEAKAAGAIETLAAPVTAGRSSLLRLEGTSGKATTVLVRGRGDMGGMGGLATQGRGDTREQPRGQSHGKGTGAAVDASYKQST
jgi:hypothetical protein